MEDRILHGDALEILPTLPPASVDLVFADPPYNLQLQRDLWRPNMTRVDAVNDDWDQFEDFAAYDAFTRAWLGEVRRVMKDTATIWVSGTYHNIFRVGTILQDLGFWLLNTVTWFKRNAMPNFRGIRLKNDVEFIIWAKYSDTSKYTFNHHLMKQFNDFYPGKQLGCVWAVPPCSHQERLRDAEGHKLHSTQKPESLLKRIILASSRPGDTVLDPFLGTGTTAAVARQLRRRWIGIERDSLYVNAASARVEAVKPLSPDHALLRTAVRRRVPFRVLVEQGYLHPGQRLHLDRTDQTAVILEDGKVQANGFTGSIHQLGARLKNVPSCNGWKHWYYRDEQTGQYAVIDTLREKVRQRNEQR